MEVREYTFGEGPRERVVLWASRHPPLPAQLEALASRLGRVRVVQVAGRFRDAEEVLELARKHNAEAIVPVLPLSFIARLVEPAGDVAVLMAEMELVEESTYPDVVLDPAREVMMEYRGEDGRPRYRKYRFKQFIRVRQVRVEGEPW